ncbi:MAG: NAD-dependent epimerase/dehydratase family protein [Gaiellaceae bacterium]
MSATSRKALVTGSSGLVGSEMVRQLTREGWRVEGVDNNMRRDFFGPGGDTTGNLRRLTSDLPEFVHRNVDIRDRAAVFGLFEAGRFDLVVHAAAQPSHDLAASRPFDDFEVNAVATLNLLEACRRHSPQAPFAFLSTNKVYGDAPNEVPLVELETRWAYADGRAGIDESCRVDKTMHSLFGASKLAADVLVQEYGRYFGLQTACFRAGCITGASHAAGELHGFLAYIARAIRERLPYRIFGYKGKQVRDNIHARDVCGAIQCFVDRPTPGAVYNLGGGAANSISVVDAIARLEDLMSLQLETEYVEEARRGDHICYITDLSLFRADYPEWTLTTSLNEILLELATLQPAAAS